MLLWSLSVVMVSPLWSTSVSRRVWARRSLASPSPTVGCTYKMAREMGARDRGTRDRPLDRRSARSFFPPCGLLPLSVPTSVLWWFLFTRVLGTDNEGGGGHEERSGVLESEGGCVWSGGNGPLASSSSSWGLTVPSWPPRPSFAFLCPLTRNGRCKWLRHEGAKERKERGREGKGTGDYNQRPTKIEC